MSIPKSYNVVPREAIDKILFSMFSTSKDESYKKKIWNLAGAIGRLGTTKVKDRNGNDIDIYRIPSSWYNWIKDQYESPI